MDLVKRIRSKMMNDHLMFVYRGAITEINSISMLALLEREMESSDYEFKSRKRLFMFVLENLQNIIRHGEHLHYSDMSVVVYSKRDEGYTITTENIIDNKNISDLKSRLEYLNRLDMSEIKELFRQILANSEFSSKGGAGLGLIEMTSKTGNKLDFDFVPYNDNHSYFILSKTVDSEGIGINLQDNEKPFNSSSVTHLEQLMAENSIYMIWSGLINSDIGGEVLSLTESKLSEDNIETYLRRRIYSILVEVLENMAKYSPGIEIEKKSGMPVVIVRVEDGAFILTTGNLILNSGINDLRYKLDTINSFSKESLKDFFVKSLSSQTIESDSTGNMGLIEAARKSGNKLHYQFEQVNDLYSYFVLTVKVKQNYS